MLRTTIFATYIREDYMTDNESNIHSIGENADMFAEYLAFSKKYPTAEESMLRLAMEKALMTKQRKVWEWYNYDRLTAVEIAKKLHVDPSSASRQIKTIEKQLQKWCADHMEAYNAIKGAQDDYDANDQGC